MTTAEIAQRLLREPTISERVEKILNQVLTGTQGLLVTAAERELLRMGIRVGFASGLEAMALYGNENDRTD